MGLETAFKVIDQVPWERVSSALSSADKKSRLEDIKRELTIVLAEIAADSASWEVQAKISGIAEQFKALSKEIGTKTDAGKELYSKSKVNEVIIWNLAEYSERSIYLAGKASTDERIVEPYKTQILNQATHACLHRYRQTTKIREYLSAKLDGGIDKDIKSLVDNMVRSLLNQMLFFADLAYEKNKDHVLGAYHVTVANLMAGYERRLFGQESLAKHHEERAFEICNLINPPEAGIHYMQRQYHLTNYTEFLGMERLSAKHETVSERFRMLHDAAEGISLDSVLIPKDNLDIGSLVGTGLRAASISAVLVAVGGFSGVETDDIMSAVAEVWQKVAGLVGAEDDGLFSVVHEAKMDPLLLNTGGVAQIALNTGGLADKIALIA